MIESENDIVIRVDAALHNIFPTRVFFYSNQADMLRICEWVVSYLLRGETTREYGKIVAQHVNHIVEEKFSAEIATKCGILQFK